MTSQQVFGESDRYKIRQWKISDEVICALLRQTLIWVTPDWDQKIGFLTYLENKNVNMKKLKKKLFPEQLKTLHEDPTGVNRFDITLTCTLLRYCGGGLANEHDTAWSSESGKEPECLITALKDVRNAIAHETLNLDKKDFFEKTEEIRKLMEKALSSIGKICSHVSQTDIDTKIANFNKKLNEIRDADIAPKTFDEYKKELLFSEQIALIINKGVPILKEVLDRNTTTSPLSLIVKGDERQVPVNEIFTEIQLDDDGKKKEVLLEDLIDIASGTDAGSFILLKGHAGMGKSTLVKKITSDWVKQQTSIKGLCSFDLLFYAELREYLKTFHRLLECSLGEVHRSFRNEDLVKAVLELRTLVILDGYDELNRDSSELFQEVMSLNKCYSQLTTIVTTRPEAEEKLNTQLKSTTLNAVHLRLVGIKAHKREEFVTKYFLSLTKDSKALRKLDKLLEFLRKTGHRMSIVWEVPYNLCLLTILWMFKPDVVNSITTEAELYWQIFLLIISKLQERLQRNPFTSHFPSSLLKNKTNQFLEDLSSESLIALKENNINIPQSSYRRISDLCIKLDVPDEELAGAFLKKIVTLNDSYYSFPHKGYMEFMAAYYIFLQVTKQNINPLAMQKSAEQLSQTSFVAYMQSKTLYLRERVTRKPTLTNILKRLHGGSLPNSLEKYQNLLIQTLSIFHVGEVEVPEATKIEALKLLRKSGLSDKDSFLKVMHNIKCNEKLSRWIAQRFNLFDGDTIIRDSSIESYIALLAATDPPLPIREEIKIDILLDDTPTSIEMLVTQLSRHRLFPRKILLTKYFLGSSSTNPEETESIKIILTKDCVIYAGIWSPTFQIPPNIAFLKVRLPDQPSLDAFCESLEKTKVAVWLKIHFNVNDVSRVSRPIPFLGEDPRVWVYVSDVKEEDIKKVGDILRALQPQDASRSFFSIRFPRCSLRSPEEFLRLLDSLKGVRVRRDISFPKDKRPDDEALRGEIHLEAKDSIGCVMGISWTTDEEMFRES